jgi:hypothetical protein
VPNGYILVGMSAEEPKLIVKKAPHAAIWSVWAMLKESPSEEIFEGTSEEEASNWINTHGPAWLEERRRKRDA